MGLSSTMTCRACRCRGSAAAMRRTAAAARPDDHQPVHVHRGLVVAVEVRARTRASRSLLFTTVVQANVGAGLDAACLSAWRLLALGAAWPLPANTIAPSTAALTAHASVDFFMISSLCAGAQDQLEKQAGRLPAPCNVMLPALPGPLGPGCWPVIAAVALAALLAAWGLPPVGLAALPPPPPPLPVTLTLVVALATLLPGFTSQFSQPGTATASAVQSMVVRAPRLMEKNVVLE